MEHRWGWRVRVNQTARVGERTGPMSIARLRDLSASGAFLETSLPLPLFSRIRVQLNSARGAVSRAIEAHVVRATADGVGIEWCEFAPPAVMQSLRATNDAPALAPAPVTTPAVAIRSRAVQPGRVELPGAAAQLRRVASWQAPEAGGASE